MKQKPSHTLIGMAFIAACLIFAGVLYAMIRTPPEAHAQQSADATDNELMAATDALDNAAATQATPAASPQGDGPAIASDAEIPPEDICNARVLRDVTALEHPETKMVAGSVWNDVTQFWRNQRTGETRFCAHGDYCYPAQITVDGQTVDTIKLINCVVRDRGGQAEADGDYLFSVERP